MNKEALRLLDEINEAINKAHKEGLTPYPMWGHEIGLKIVYLRDLIEGGCSGR